MVKRVVVIGTDKEFFTLVEEGMLGLNPEISWLEFENGFDIINYCLSNKELPEIVFTEMFLLKIDGITLLDYLSTYFPEIMVVGVVDELNSDIIRSFSEVGAAGLMKKSDAHVFFKIIDSVNGCRIVKTFLNDITPVYSATKRNLLQYRITILKKYRITKRESLFLLLNATGLDYMEIAKLMFISRKTVDNLFNSVAKKFGVQNRLNLTLFCIRMKLVKISTAKINATPYNC